MALPGVGLPPKYPNRSSPEAEEPIGGPNLPLSMAHPSLGDHSPVDAGTVSLDPAARPDCYPNQPSIGATTTLTIIATG
jgi:hypothetical protein